MTTTRVAAAAAEMQLQRQKQNKNIAIVAENVRTIGIGEGHRNKSKQTRKKTWLLMACWLGTAADDYWPLYVPLHIYPEWPPWLSRSSITTFTPDRSIQPVKSVPPWCIHTKHWKVCIIPPVWVGEQSWKLQLNAIPSFCCLFYLSQDDVILSHSVCVSWWQFYEPAANLCSNDPSILACSLLPTPYCTWHSI